MASFSRSLITTPSLPIWQLQRLISAKVHQGGIVVGVSLQRHLFWNHHHYCSLAVLHLIPGKRRRSGAGKMLFNSLRNLSSALISCIRAKWHACSTVVCTGGFKPLHHLNHTHPITKNVCSPLLNRKQSSGCIRTGVNISKAKRFLALWKLRRRCCSPGNDRAHQSTSMLTAAVWRRRRRRR